MLAQRALNELSRTDLESHLLYLESVRTYHEELKGYFFPAVFRETPVEGVAWEDAPRHWHSDRAAAVPTPLASVVVLFGVAGVLFAAAVVQFGRSRTLS